MDFSRFRALAPRQRALVSMAVMVDGQDAVQYLEHDAVHGEILGKVAASLASIDLELRIPLLGSLARQAFREISQEEA